MAATSLAADFQKRREWLNHRASAVFPCRVDARNDNVIAFLDYWRIKNGIDNVCVVIRLRDPAGAELDHRSLELGEQDHYALSIRELFGLDRFEGSVDVEVISTRNLRFPFPAAVCFYVNDAAVSVVHSAGRVLNAHEPNARASFRETNFTCRYDDETVPFFHLFNGPTALGDDHGARLVLRGSDNRVLLDKSFATGLCAPFSSRLFLLDELLAPEERERLLGADFFATVEFEIPEIFGRLVVGNKRLKEDALLCTHSFQLIDPESGDITDRDGADVASILPIVCASPLTVSAVSFPTNAARHLAVSARGAGLGAPLSDLEESYELVSGGADGRVFTHEIAGDVFKTFNIADDAPSRLNVSYRYAVAGRPGHFTDIATGFKSRHYPPKHSHWGHALQGGGFDSVLLCRNCSHSFAETRDSEVRLTLYGSHGRSEQSFTVPGESAIGIRLSEHLPPRDREEILSWFAATSEGTVEFFWVSYSEDGRICGEHAF